MEADARLTGAGLLRRRGFQPEHSGRAEAGDHVVAVGPEELADVGDGVVLAPGAALDHEAGCARCEAERAGLGFGGPGGENAGFGLGPGDMGEEPAAGRFGGEIGCFGGGDSGQVDEALFEGEGGAVCPMDEAEIEEPGAGGEAAGIVGAGAAYPAGNETEAVASPTGGDLCAEIGNVEHHGVETRAGDDGAGALAARDEPGGRKRGQRLAHRHAGAGVMRHQLLLGGQAFTRREAAVEDLRFEIGADARVERLPGRDCSRHARRAASVCR